MATRPVWSQSSDLKQEWFEMNWGEVAGTVIIGFARELRVWELSNPVFISVDVWRKVSLENQMETKGKETFWFLPPLIWKS